MDGWRFGWVHLLCMNIQCSCSRLIAKLIIDLFTVVIIVGTTPSMPSFVLAIVVIIVIFMIFDLNFLHLLSSLTYSSINRVISHSSLAEIFQCRHFFIQCHFFSCYCNLIPVLCDTVNFCNMTACQVAVFPTRLGVPLTLAIVNSMIPYVIMSFGFT